MSLKSFLLLENANCSRLHGAAVSSVGGSSDGIVFFVPSFNTAGLNVLSVDLEPAAPAGLRSCKDVNSLTSRGKVHL